MLLLNRPYKHEFNSDSGCRHSASCFQIPPGLMRMLFNGHPWFHPCRYLSPHQVKGSPLSGNGVKWSRPLTRVSKKMIRSLKMESEVATKQITVERFSVVSANHLPRWYERLRRKLVS